MFHGPTLLIVYFAFTLLTTLLLLSAALVADRPKRLANVAAGNVFSMAGLLAGALSEWPLWLHAVLSYGLMTLGMCLVWRGLLDLSGRRLAWRWTALVVACGLALAAFFAYAQPSMQGRLVSACLLNAGLNLMCVRALTGLRPASTRSLVWVSASGFTVIALFLFWRAATLVLVPDDPAWQEAGTNLTYFIVPLAQVTVAFGLILLLTREYSEQLREAALTDPLTGALNRAGFDEQAQRLLRRAQRNGSGLSLWMVDADHFKDINDRHGHPAGDQALRLLVQHTREVLRPGDLLARYGGEEFLVLLDNVDQEAALRAAERLRASIAQTPMPLGSQWVNLTVSIGVSDALVAGYALSDLIGRADAAVYRAKAAGRNRVVSDGVPSVVGGPAAAVG